MNEKLCTYEKFWAAWLHNQRNSMDWPLISLSGMWKLNLTWITSDGAVSAMKKKWHYLNKTATTPSYATFTEDGPWYVEVIDMMHAKTFIRFAAQAEIYIVDTAWNTINQSIYQVSWQVKCFYRWMGHLCFRMCNVTNLLFCCCCCCCCCCLNELLATPCYTFVRVIGRYY